MLKDTLSGRGSCETDTISPGFTLCVGQIFLHQRHGKIHRIVAGGYASGYGLDERAAGGAVDQHREGLGRIHSTLFDERNRLGQRNSLNAADEIVDQLEPRAAPYRTDMNRFAAHCGENRPDAIEDLTIAADE